jgi:uncharacterized membrane protein
MESHMSEVQVPPAPLADPTLSAEERLWAAVAHQTLACMIFPYLWSGGIFATFVLMKVFRSRSSFVSFHSRQTLYAQLALALLLGPIWITTRWTPLSSLPRAVLWLLATWSALGGLVFLSAIIANTTAVSRTRLGQDYEYPLIGRWARLRSDRSSPSSDPTAP